MSKRDADQLVKAAREQGFIVELKKGTQHWHFWLEIAGEVDSKGQPRRRFVCDLAGTPSSRRAVDNSEAMLRKAGYVSNPRQHGSKRKNAR